MDDVVHFGPGHKNRKILLFWRKKSLLLPTSSQCRIAVQFVLEETSDIFCFRCLFLYILIYKLMNVVSEFSHQ